MEGREPGELSGALTLIVAFQLVLLVCRAALYLNTHSENSTCSLITSPQGSWGQLITAHPFFRHLCQERRFVLIGALQKTYISTCYLFILKSRDGYR